MGFLKKIKAAIFGAADGEIKDKEGIYFYVKCSKCGSPVRVRVNKLHDLHRNEDYGGFVLRKEIMDGSCFRLMYATVRFDHNRKIIEQEIEGGEFIDWETYRALTQPRDEPEEQETAAS